MRLILFATLFLAVPAAMAAETAVSETAVSATAAAETSVQASDVRKRMVVWDKDGARVGPIIAVAARADGSVDFVTVIQSDKSVRISGATLSLADGRLSTSLARREIGR